MTAHSLLGASSAHRWLACPGSFRLSQTAPHRPTSRYAAAGTIAHGLIERSAKNAFRPLDASEIGKTWLCDGHSGVIDEAFVAGINVMIDYLRSVPSDVVTIEHRLSLDDYFSPPPSVPLFGTSDAVLASWRPATLEIVDYKNGSGVPVQPVWNSQLMYYAAGAVAEWAAMEPPGGWTRIRLTVVQPHAGGAPVRSWDLAPIDLSMWIEEVLIPGVRACEAPDAPLKAGEWCRFCPVSQHCPLLHESAQAAAKAEFDEIEVPTEGSELAAALEQAERAEMWIAAVREHALDQLQRQVAIPGWTLVPTRATRKWVKPDDDIAAALRGAGALPNVIYETKVRSPASLEKVLTWTREGRQLWANEVQGQGLFERRSSGVKVGRSDTPSAQDEFDEF